MIPFERNPNPRRRRGHDAARRPASPMRRMQRAARGRAQARRSARRISFAPRTAWLLAPLFLLSVAAGLLFVFRGPDRVFSLAFGLVLGMGFLWILISVFFPARAERTCPQCGERTLERIDARSTLGLRCRACAWRDESASAFVHAEEEGALEDIVLRERRRGRGGSRRW